MAWIWKYLAQTLIGWLVEILGGLIARALRRKKIEEKAKESVEPLKKAKSADEIDKASDEALDGF